METKNRERMLLIATGALLAFVVLNWMIISPLRASWHRRADRITQLRKEIADGTMMLRRGDYVRERWNTMNTNALSSTPTVAERQLFDAFDHWVRNSAVTEGSFKPQLKQTDENYAVMECRADVTGSPKTIGDFLTSLASDPMGIRVQSLELASRDDNGRQLSLALELDGLLLSPPAQ